MDNPFRPGRSPLVHVGNPRIMRDLGSHLRRVAAGQVSGFINMTQLVTGPTGWGVSTCLDWAATEAERLDLVVLRLKFAADQDNWAMLMSRVMGLALAHYPKKPPRDIKKPMKAAVKFFEHFEITDPATHPFPLIGPRLRDQTASWSAHVDSLKPLLALATFCVTEADRAGLLIIIDDIHHATRMEVENLSSTRAEICEEDGPLAMILGGNQHIINHRRNQADTDKDPDDTMPRKDFAGTTDYTEYRLSRLSDEEVTTLVSTTTPQNPWDPQALTELIRITNGIPWAIHDLGHQLWASNPPTPGHSITPADLEPAVTHYRERLHTTRYPHIWEELSATSQDLLRHLALVTDERQRWYDAELRQTLIGHPRRDHLITVTQGELDYHGITAYIRSKTAAVVLPFFMDYVRALAAAPQS